ncbi:hypothetical protein GW17_00026877 [Ensete ventricosum]|nr:hypothetical protein GW17_00026877 [Ensete ventricosum]
MVTGYFCNLTVSTAAGCAFTFVLGDPTSGGVKSRVGRSDPKDGVVIDQSEPDYSASVRHDAFVVDDWYLRRREFENDAWPCREFNDTIPMLMRAY